MGKSLRDQAREEDARRSQDKLVPHEPSGRELQRGPPPPWLLRLWAQIQALMVSCLFFTTCLSAQSKHYAGISSCSHNVAVTDPIYVVSGVDSAETVAHEAIHRQQMSVNCDSVYALWSNNLDAKMEAEAEAACGGMKAVGKTPEQRHLRAVQYTMWWMKFRGGESFDTYLERYDRWCK